MDKTYGPTPEQTAGQRARQPAAFEKKQFRRLLGKRQKTPEDELPLGLHPSLEPGRVTYTGNKQKRCRRWEGPGSQEARRYPELCQTNCATLDMSLPSLGLCVHLYTRGLDTVSSGSVAAPFLGNEAARQRGSPRMPAVFPCNCHSVAGPSTDVHSGPAPSSCSGTWQPHRPCTSHAGALFKTLRPPYLGRPLWELLWVMGHWI